MLIIGIKVKKFQKLLIIKQIYQNYLKSFKKPTSLEEINNVFNINDFLKSMALDYVVNNEHAYLYNATNYFLYLDKSSNQWNYHEGYYSSPFNTWDKQSLSLPYNNYRFNRNSTEAMKRPTFDYLISFTDKQFKFENYIEDIIYNYIANGKVFKRMESIYRMIHNDLKWDNLIEINNNNNNNNNKTSQLTKRNNDNNLDFEEEFNNLKNWIKYRGDIDFYKFKIPFNLYSLFTNAFLIAIIFIVIHLLYALFINPIVWFFSDKEVRVLPSTLLKLWCMTLGILMVVGTSLYFWTHDKWKPNLYQVLERQVYNYIINFYGPTSKLDNTVNIILWLIINRENFLILIFAPFVRWPKLKKNQRNSNGNYYKKPNNSETTLNNLLFEDDNSIVNHSINDTTFINCSSSSNSNPSIEIKNTDSQNENKEVRDRIFEEPFDDNDDANEYPCSPTNKNNSSIDEIDVIDILENNPCSPIEPKSYNNSFISNNTMDNDDDDIIAAVAAVAAAVASDDEEEEDDDDTISQMTQSVNERLSIKSSRIEEKNDKVFHSKNIPSYSDEQAEIIGMYKSVRHGFLIVCHNSSDVLPETLKCLLKVTTPMSIFIAENGSCQEEKVKMKEVIDYYSQQYKDTHPNYHGLDIIYANLNEGSKTLAQFCLLNNLYWFGIDIEYISVIDDDVLIPENWKEEEILSYFQDPNVKALAYPITTSNRREGIVPAFQNFEYTLSMYSKKIHRDIGTVVFPSGAIGTWSVPFLLECLYRHDTVFRGEDLQLGIRLHTLYGKPKFCNPNEKHCGNYKIEIAHVSVSTLVPGCYMHLKEYLPHFLGKYLKDCKCGQYSLSRQRIVFWEPARHRFLFKFLDCITHKCKWNHRATLTAKLCCTDFIITIFNDYLFIILFAFLFIKGSYVQALMIICISYALAYLSLDVFNLVIAHGRPDIKLPFEVCVVFPVCYQSVSTFFYRISTIIYTISYYVPFVRNKTKIKKRALKGDISNMTMSEIITNEDSEKAIANVSDIAEYLKNQKKSKKHYLKFNNKHFKHSNNKKLNVKEENEIENEEEDDDNLTYNLDLTEIILDSFDEQSENDDNNTNNNDNDNDNDNNNDNINEIHIIN
ncbi:hypothetical protein BCR32DRAFT_295122 [Anaeromyces robustus]|uniref:Uncharacterized protein n=1 Tax=Anaeromyces robustus TaxID=1754192 RepID=A0A1Y1WXL1_9FUNG|nr:hypothetical protein BCR32DRAFT_295122 [Anaeromyces robustus]|eukprot:ORX78309.1 hypothetical protein BCR32DRAFT_295122 [Anaeromyces robustus]